MPSRVPKKDRVFVVTCPKCASKVVYYRTRPKNYLCRRCGHTFRGRVFV